MKYLEFTFRTSPCTEVVNDVLSAILGDAGFESFVEQEGGIAAYIQKDLYDETTVKTAIDEFPLPDTQIEYTFTEAEDKDWNEEWEKNFFQPIVIGDRCVIHSTFHHDVPQTEYDIVIRKWLSVQDITKPPVSSSVNYWTVTYKAGPFSIWVAALPSLPFLLACVVQNLVLPSILMNGAFVTHLKTSN